MKNCLITDDRKDLSNSLIQFSYLKNGRTEAQGENIFSRFHKFRSMYWLFSQAYYTPSVIHISVDNWMNKKKVLPLHNIFQSVQHTKTKLLWSEFNPGNAGLNTIKQVSGSCFAHFQEGVLCVQHERSLSSLGVPRGSCALWLSYGQCDSSEFTEYGGLDIW